MEIMLENIIMKINLKNNDKSRVSVEDNCICFNFNIDDLNEIKKKFEYDIKLELHLRNSEAVGIPIIGDSCNKELFQNGLRLISHSVYKPLRGTHDKVYITFDTSKLDKTFLPCDKAYSLRFVFVSKLYWELLCKKYIDGIQSVPVEINEIP